MLKLTKISDRHFNFCKAYLTIQTAIVGIVGIPLFFPTTSHASFIESTIGTAVVNDATAAYFNPAALTLVNNSQFIALDTIAYSHSHFNGQATQVSTGFTQFGSSNSKTHYNLPSLYVSTPISKQAVIGFAILSNDFTRDIENNSLLRYVQSNNSIQDIDFVPAIGFNINKIFSVGVGINLSHARFLLLPISGFPSLNIPDSQSRNDTTANSWGADIGLLMKLSKSTLVGFNYRSDMTYPFTGSSIFEVTPPVVSNHFSFKFWTPARYVMSANYSFSSTLGFIGTVQYILFSKLKTINVHNIATVVNAQPFIIPNAQLPFQLHNAWILTTGSYYRVTPKWTIRGAGSYIQSPGNARYQISTGDNLVIGLSMAYKITKNFIIDGSYAHAFVIGQNIHVVSRYIIIGKNGGNRNSISLKLTVNV